jgi:hypothetical protein
MTSVLTTVLTASMLTLAPVGWTLKNPQLVPLRPELWADKFPEQRGPRVIALVTAEMQERITKQNAANRLVFDNPSCYLAYGYRSDTVLSA